VHLLSKHVDRHTKIYLIPDNDKTGLKQVAENVKLIKRRIRNPISVLEFPEGIKDSGDVLTLGGSLDMFESVHHEMFLLIHELDKCLEQTDDDEVANELVSYTKNEMIRAQLADH